LFNIIRQTHLVPSPGKRSVVSAEVIIHHPAADDFTTIPGKAAAGCYALLKGNP